MDVIAITSSQTPTFCRLLAGNDNPGDVHSSAEVYLHGRPVSVQATQLDTFVVGIVALVTGSDVTRRRGRKPRRLTHVALRVRSPKTVQPLRLLVGDVLHCTTATVSSADNDVDDDDDDDDDVQSAQSCR